MNYKKIYWNLIKKAITRPTTKHYMEGHHIIPKFAGGPDRSYNIVKLTAKEHIFAHKLLFKIYGCKYTHPYAINTSTIELSAKRVMDNLLMHNNLTNELKDDLIDACHIIEKVKKNREANRKYIINKNNQSAKTNTIIKNDISKCRKQIIDSLKKNINKITIDNILSIFEYDDKFIKIGNRNNINKTIQKLKIHIIGGLSFTSEYVNNQNILTNYLDTLKCKAN